MPKPREGLGQDPDAETADARIFAALLSPSPLDRSAAAAALMDVLEEKYSLEHHYRVAKLIESPDPRERAGGLAAIGALTMIDGDDLGPRLSTYGPPLRWALVRSLGSSPEVVREVCKHYDELLRRARDPDALQKEARWALAALGEDADPSDPIGSSQPPELRLLVGVITLRQLTLQAPTAVYPLAATALELLWRPLTFQSAQVRSAASDALLALLVVVAPRASRYLTQWYRV